MFFLITICIIVDGEFILCTVATINPEQEKFESPDLKTQPNNSEKYKINIKPNISQIIDIKLF